MRDTRPVCLSQDWSPAHRAQRAPFKEKLPQRPVIATARHGAVADATDAMLSLEAPDLFSKGPFGFMQCKKIGMMIEDLHQPACPGATDAKEMDLRAFARCPA